MTEFEVPNPALRAHTTGGFALVIPRTAIAQLVILDHEIRHRAYVRESVGARKANRVWTQSITGLRILQDRGLIKWTDRRDQPRPEGMTSWPIADVFEITKAGKAVIILLLEAGVYQEYAAQLEPRSEWRVDGHADQMWTESEAAA